MKLFKWGCLSSLVFWGGLFGLAVITVIGGISTTATGDMAKIEGLRLTWPVQGIVTERFGMRASPTPPYRQEMHYGVDVAADVGAPVTAVTNGRVHLAAFSGGYGNLVIIVSADGRLMTWYGHLSGYAVAQGATVSLGQVIGYVGSTGRSTGAHLHFEVRPLGGAPVDPLPLLEASVIPGRTDG